MCPTCSKQPSIADQVSGLTKSMTGWASKGFPFTPREQNLERISICKECDSLDRGGFAGMGKCRECGCAIVAKARIATEKCPIGKW